MNWKESIRSSIRTIAESEKIADKPDVFYAEVDSVDDDSRTCSCTLISGTSDISLTTVNLMAEVNDGMLRIPTIGSTVYILSTPNVTPWVDVFSELDKIFYVAGGSTVLITDSVVELQGNTYGGVPKVEPSVAAWKAIQDDINNLKQIITTLCATPLVTTSVGSPDAFYTAFNTATATYKTQTLTVTVKSDIENLKVQHGDNS